MPPRDTRLASPWQNRDFRLLWSGQTISLLGSQITILALPLTAALALDTTPIEMGILAAAQTAPFLLFGLVAGVWVDRLRRRPLLIAADLGRAVLLGSIPMAALVDGLTLAQLYLVAFLVGALTLLFEVAYQAYLPSLLPAAQIVAGNSRLTASQATGELVGPGLGGALVQALSAPLALLADACSYIASALLLLRVRTPEPPPRAERFGAALGVGLRATRAQPLLWTTAVASGLFGFFAALWNAVYILYATERLELAPVALSLVYASGSVGGLLGALAADELTRRWGLGPTILTAAVLSAVGTGLIPLVGDASTTALVMQILARLLLGFSDTIFVVNVVSLRQALTPVHLQGRVSAASRFIADGPAPLGALLGGVIGERFGLRVALIVGAIGGTWQLLWLWRSPLRRVRAAPEATDG